jgi:hypothetical protein
VTVFLTRRFFCGPLRTQNESGLKSLMKIVQQIEEETKRIDEDVIVER